MGRRNSDAWKARGQWGSSNGGSAGRSGGSHGGGKDKGASCFAGVVAIGVGVAGVLGGFVAAGLRIGGVL
jgi:hypothetical protein